jgi:hypothetical protein
VAGVVLGGLLSAVSLLLLPELSDQTILVAYAVVVLFVSAALLSSVGSGLLLGLFTIIAETVIELVYFVSGYSTGVPLNIADLPFAVGLTLFVGRILLFPVSGAIGGYLGRELFAKKKSKGKRLGEKTRKRQPRA